MDPVDEFPGASAMSNIFALFLASLLFTGTPAYAQTPCLECLNTADEELNRCLENAISVEDKNSCEDKPEEQVKTCEKSECTVERESRDTGADAPSPGR